jgi:hypothetical protein
LPVIGSCLIPVDQQDLVAVALEPRILGTDIIDGDQSRFFSPAFALLPQVALCRKPTRICPSFSSGRVQEDIRFCRCISFSIWSFSSYEAVRQLAGNPPRQPP